MNSRILFIAFLVIGSLIAALVSKDGDIALLALPFLTYLVAGVLLKPADVHLRVTRSFDRPSAPAFSPVNVKLSITNEGTEVKQVLIRDNCPSGMEVIRGTAEKSIRIPAKATIEMDYTFKAPCGTYAWEEIQTETADIFGLFPSVRFFTARGDFLVWPGGARLRHIPVRPRNTLHGTGSIPSRTAGSGTDFWSVRNYLPGDQLHRLNWRLTARHPQQLFTNEFEQEEIINIGLILDTRMPYEDVKHNRDLLNHSIQAAASLAETFLREGNRVGLLIFGQKMTYRFPGYGKRQLTWILRSLACTSASPNISMINIEYMCSRLFPGQALLVMVSPIQQGDERIYTRLRSHGYPLLMVSPDPVGFAQKQLQPSLVDALAVRTARIERDLQLQQLVNLGIQVIDWPVDHSLNDVIQTSCKYYQSQKIKGGGR